MLEPTEESFNLLFGLWWYGSDHALKDRAFIALQISHTVPWGGSITVQVELYLGHAILDPLVLGLLPFSLK